MKWSGFGEQINMVVTYYADVIFIWNFVLDFFLLFLIHPEKRKRYHRLILAAVIGAGATLMMLYLSVNAILLFFILRFLGAGVMVSVAIPARGVGELLCNTALLYGISGCLYGAYALLADLIACGEDRILLVMLVSMGVLMGGKALFGFRKKQYQRQTYQLIVKIRNGPKMIEKKAFFDSGNHLFEPISGKPVILVRNSVMRMLDVKPETLRVVPYSSLGNQCGMLEAYPVEEIMICGGARERQFKHIYISVGDDEMFLQEHCDVILHAELGGENL